MAKRERSTSLGSGIDLSTRSNHFQEVLADLWKNKNLPLSTRRKLCGAIQRAALRQGDGEIIPKDIIKQIEDPNVHALHPDDEIRMINLVDRWAFGDRARLRPQYAQICLKIAVKDLEENHAALAREAAAKIATAAKLN